MLYLLKLMLVLIDIYVCIFHTYIRTAVGYRLQNLIQIALNSGVALNLRHLIQFNFWKVWEKVLGGVVDG